MTAFSIKPDSVTLTGPDAATCGSDIGGTGTHVFVYGGAGPYKIDVTFPDFVTVDRTEVGSQGEFFTVNFGGCVAPGLVIVTDSLGRQATLTLTSSVGS